MATTAPNQLDFPIDQHEPYGLYEVIDGRIVEKTVGAYECWLASVIFGAPQPVQHREPGWARGAGNDLRPVALC